MKLGNKCPDCGKPGRWRSGVGFEHEKICMNKAGHRDGRDCVWEPGAEIEDGEREGIVIPVNIDDDNDACAPPAVVVRNKKHLTIALAKVVDAINEKYSPVVKILEGATVKLVGNTLEIEWETRL
jgi:hypothetical protein